MNREQFQNQVLQGVARINKSGRCATEVRLNPSEMHRMGLHGGLLVAGLPIVEDLTLQLGEALIVEADPQPPRTCRREGCANLVAKRAHGVGWEKDYCSATCAFQDN